MWQFIKAVGETIWKILNFTRSAIANLIFVLVVGVLVGMLAYEHEVTVQEGSVLVIDLSGAVVEQSQFSGDVFTSLLKGSEPETRLRDVLRAFELAAEDRRISTVWMRLDDLQAIGMASLREIGSAMDRFKASGKKIIVWSTAYSQKQYAIATHASEVYMHPMGQVLLKGLTTQKLYWGDALRELGVTVHVFKAGEFKSAPETLVLNAPSKAALKADQYWLDDVWKQLTQSMESSRGLMPGAIDRFIAQLPEKLEKAQGDMSQVALADSLIDAIKTDDEIREMLLAQQNISEQYESLRTVDYRNYLAANSTEINTSKVVAVLTIEGEIKDGEDAPGMIGARPTVQRIRAIREDDNIAALVVRIDSPGGSAVASELIRRELELVRQAGKPVIASFGDYAASGGYWIALAANKIIADPLSVTGSIGVFGIVPTFEKILDKFSVGSGGASTSKLANVENLTLAMDDDAEKILQLSVARTYRDFVRLVSKARQMDIREVNELAQGRVYTGQQAQQKGLVDELGGIAQAVELAARLAGVSEEQLYWVEPSPGRLSLVMQRFMAQVLQGVGVQSMLAPYVQWPSERIWNETGALMQLVSQPTMPYAYCVCPRL